MMAVQDPEDEGGGHDQGLGNQHAVGQGTISDTIEAMAKLSRQKAGGTFNPIFKRSSNSCILCSQSCTCYGSACMGPGQTIIPRTFSFPSQVRSKSSIPGLSDQASQTSLIELRFPDTSKKIPIVSTLPCGEIFGWKSKNHSVLKVFNSTKSFSTSHSNCASSSTLAHKSIIHSKKPSVTTLPANHHCSTQVYDRTALQALLRRCGAKFKRKKSSISSVTKCPLPTSSKSALTVPSKAFLLFKPFYSY